MIPTRSEIESLVVRIQNDFLDTPALQLSVGQVARRAGIGASTCEAVLQALVDARVLAVTPGGAYERFFPRPADRPRSRAA